MPFKELKLSSIASGANEDTLHCPSCDEYYMHQGKVEVFNRTEDAESGTHVLVDGDSVQTNRDLSGNPSARRHGLTIHFHCENCNATSQMHISQHKGNTHIGMEYQRGKVA